MNDPTNDPQDALLQVVSSYYSRRLEEFGATPRGVDWNSADAQRARFVQLARVLEGVAPEVGVIDYGCGYGAFLDFLDESGERRPYQGFDVSRPMVEAAQARHPQRLDCMFTHNPRDLRASGCTVASGIFNVKLDIDEMAWRRHVLQTLDAIDALSAAGFAFNMLTSHSDRDRQRPDLYYADPVSLFHYCIARFSRRVALLHDYPLYEFTVIVRK